MKVAGGKVWRRVAIVAASSVDWEEEFILLLSIQWKKECVLLQLYVVSMEWIIVP